MARLAGKNSIYPRRSRAKFRGGADRRRERAEQNCKDATRDVGKIRGGSEFIPTPLLWRGVSGAQLLAPLVVRSDCNSRKSRESSAAALIRRRSRLIGRSSLVDGLGIALGIDSDCSRPHNPCRRRRKKIRRGREKEGRTMQPGEEREKEEERGGGRRVTEVYSLFCDYSKRPRPDVQNSRARTTSNEIAAKSQGSVSRGRVRDRTTTALLSPRRISTTR